MCKLFVTEITVTFGHVVYTRNISHANSRLTLFQLISEYCFRQIEGLLHMCALK